MIPRPVLLAKIAAIMLSVPAAASAQSLEVATDTGKVAGAVQDGIDSWKGIPFATPPVGPLRWSPPQPAVKWDGVLNATEYKNDCMQLPFPSDAAPLGTPPAEDCLYANVWKPANAAKGKKLPVIVWIYGGGFVNGGSSPPTYSGANLARQGVMVVSFNYRIGRFGTFGHPQLTAEQAGGKTTGNFGYLDQVAALKWVQRNVAAFGGDPANVTIMGESAGGMSVHTLVTSPMTSGLFAKAVIMSGGTGGGIRKDDLAAVEKTGVAFAETRGIAAGDPQALAKLRALPAEDVVAGLNLAAMFDPDNKPLPFSSPYVDGIVAADAPAAYASGKFAHVPVMVGATSADIGGKTGYMVGGARAVAAALADKGVPVYAYRFSYVAESVKEPGAQHATDIPFFFDTTAIKYGSATTPKDVGIGRAMSHYLVNFAKTGNPNGTGLPKWPRYARASDELMDFATSGKAEPQKDPWGVEIDAAPPPAR